MNNETLIATVIHDPLEGRLDSKAYKKGETILPLNSTFEDISHDFTDQEIKTLIKGYAYRENNFKGPVCLAVNFPYKVRAYEATMRTFQSFKAVQDFLEDNKGIVIYKIFKRKDKELYAVRYFDGLKFKNKLEYIYSNLMVRFRTSKLGHYLLWQQKILRFKKK